MAGLQSLARSPLLKGSNFATFTDEDTLRDYFMRRTYKSKRCVAPGLPEDTGVALARPKGVPWERASHPASCGLALTLHQFDPEVGNEEEQQ